MTQAIYIEQGQSETECKTNFSFFKSVEGLKYINTQIKRGFDEVLTEEDLKDLFEIQHELWRRGLTDTMRLYFLFFYAKQINPLKTIQLDSDSGPEYLSKLMMLIQMEQQGIENKGTLESMLSEMYWQQFTAFYVGTEESKQIPISGENHESPYYAIYAENMAHVVTNLAKIELPI